MSYTSAGTVRSRGPDSCHCQDAPTLGDAGRCPVSVAADGVGPGGKAGLGAVLATGVGVGTRVETGMGAPAQPVSAGASSADASSADVARAARSMAGGSPPLGGTSGPQRGT